MISVLSHCGHDQHFPTKIEHLFIYMFNSYFAFFTKCLLKSCIYLSNGLTLIMLLASSFSSMGVLHLILAKSLRRDVVILCIFKT